MTRTIAIGRVDHNAEGVLRRTIEQSDLIGQIVTWDAFTVGGFASFTRVVGRVFDPSVSLLFALKTLFFGLAVGLMPVATVLVDRAPERPRASVQLQSVVRLLLLVVLIEAVSLVGNYY